MNTDKLKEYILEEFPSAFELNFSREILSNILDYSEEIKDINEQITFIMEIIPQIHEKEVREFIK